MSEQEIFTQLVAIIHEAMPETRTENITMDSVINRDIGVDSMNFIMIICKVEAQFGIRIPDKVWTKLTTMRETVNAVKTLMDKKQ